MDSQTLYFALNFLVLIPLCLMWAIPIRHILRHPVYVYLLAALGEYAATFLLLKPLLEKFPEYLTFTMLLALFVVFLVGKIFTALDFMKSGVLFLWAVACMSFSEAFTHSYEIIAQYSGEPVESIIEGPIIRLVICGLFVFATYMLTQNWDSSFLTDPNVPAGLWGAFLVIPVFILHQNIVMIGQDPATITTSRQLYSCIMMLVGNFALFVFLTGTFYFIAVMYVKNSKIQEEKNYLELQHAQYTDITRDVEHTRKLIHDFKHTVSTIKTLALDGKNQEILSYLDSMGNLSAGTEIMNYCKNPAINSVLNHYAFRAMSEKVPLNLQVNLKNRLPIKDPELCSLIGNLMENAIDACLSVPEDKRHFDLSIVMQGRNLCIVSSNSFDGYIEKSGEAFVSTKHNGFGIGIKSMKETVERYNGTFRIHYKDNEFYTDIMIGCNII